MELLLLPIILKMINTPVLLLVFNRPDYTRRVFESIRKAKPARLYIASDGPRNGKEGEEVLVQECRKIAQQVDWNCDVKTLFRDKNLGSGAGVYESINWFFEQEEQGIILEDDCLPNQSYFTFSEEMLNRYRNNEQIMLVSGSNYLLGLINIAESYYFSQVPATWGWATWRRAWKYMNFEMKHYNEHIKDFPEVSKMWQPHWDSIKNGSGVKDAWDFQWYYSIYEQKGLCIHPNVNLVENIGFDAVNATHTFRPPWWYKFVITKELNQIQHPKTIKVNEKADEFVKERFLHKKPTLLQRIKLKLKHFPGKSDR